MKKLTKFLNNLLFYIIGIPFIMTLGLWLIITGKHKPRMDWKKFGRELMICFAGYGLAHLIIEIFKWGYFHGPWY
jgi:hypothetical protein